MDLNHSRQQYLGYSKLRKGNMRMILWFNPKNAHYLRSPILRLIT